MSSFFFFVCVCIVIKICLIKLIEVYCTDEFGSYCALLRVESKNAINLRREHFYKQLVQLQEVFQ